VAKSAGNGPPARNGPQVLLGGARKRTVDRVVEPLHIPLNQKGRIDWNFRRIVEMRW